MFQWFAWVPVVASGLLTRTITAVSEDLPVVTAQNTDFDTVATDFLDFTEDNPFGDPADQ